MAENVKFTVGADEASLQNLRKSVDKQLQNLSAGLNPSSFEKMTKSLQKGVKPEISFSVSKASVTKFKEDLGQQLQKAFTISFNTGDIAGKLRADIEGRLKNIQLDINRNDIIRIKELMAGVVTPKLKFTTASTKEYRYETELYFAAKPINVAAKLIVQQEPTVAVTRSRGGMVASGGSGGKGTGGGTPIIPPGGGDDNLGKASKQLKEAKQHTDELEKSTKKASDATYSFAERLGFTASRLALYGVAAGLLWKTTMGITAAANVIKDINLDITKLTQIMDGNVAKAAETAKAAMQIAEQYGQSGTELLKIGQILAQSGDQFSGDKLVKTMEALAKTKLDATFGDIKQNADGLITVLGQFNMTASQTGEILDTVSAISKKFAIEANDIFEVARAGGAAFFEAGGNFKEFAAMVATIKQLTHLPTSVIATGMSNLAQKLVQPNTVTFLESITKQVGGMRNADGTIKSVTDRLITLAEVMEDMDATDKSVVIDKISDIRNAKSILALMQDLQKVQSGTSKYQQALKVEKDSTGALDKAAKEGMKSINAELQSVGAAFQKVFTQMAADPSIKRLVDEFSVMAKALADILGLVGPLVPALTRLAAIKVGMSMVTHAQDLYSGIMRGRSPIGGAVGPRALNQRMPKIGGPPPGGAFFHERDMISGLGNMSMAQQALYDIGLHTDALMRGKFHGEAANFLKRDIRTKMDFLDFTQGKIRDPRQIRDLYEKISYDQWTHNALLKQPENPLTGSHAWHRAHRDMYSPWLDALSGAGGFSRGGRGRFPGVGAPPPGGGIGIPMSQMFPRGNEVYHGSSSAYLASIQKYGLRGSPLYYTEAPYTGMSFAALNGPSEAGSQEETNRFQRLLRSRIKRVHHVEFDKQLRDLEERLMRDFGVDVSIKRGNIDYPGSHQFQWKSFRGQKINQEFFDKNPSALDIPMRVAHIGLDRITEQIWPKYVYDQGRVPEDRYIRKGHDILSLFKAPKSHRPVLLSFDPGHEELDRQRGLGDTIMLRSAHSLQRILGNPRLMQQQYRRTKAIFRDFPNLDTQIGITEHMPRVSREDVTSIRSYEQYLEKSLDKMVTTIYRSSMGTSLRTKDRTGFAGREFHSPIDPSKIGVVTDLFKHKVIPIQEMSFKDQEAAQLQYAYSQYLRYDKKLNGLDPRKQEFADMTWDGRIFRPDARARRWMIQGGITPITPAPPPGGGLGLDQYNYQLWRINKYYKKLPELLSIHSDQNIPIYNYGFEGKQLNSMLSGISAVHKAIGSAYTKPFAQDGLGVHLINDPGKYGSGFGHHPVGWQSYYSDILTGKDPKAFDEEFKQFKILYGKSFASESELKKAFINRMRQNVGGVSPLIYLNSRNFKTKEKDYLPNTYIHEVGHITSGYYGHRPDDIVGGEIYERLRQDGLGPKVKQLYKSYSDPERNEELWADTFAYAHGYKRQKYKQFWPYFDKYKEGIHQLTPAPPPGGLVNPLSGRRISINDKRILENAIGETQKYINALNIDPQKIFRAGGLLRSLLSPGAIKERQEVLDIRQSIPQYMKVGGKWQLVNPEMPKEYADKANPFPHFPFARDRIVQGQFLQAKAEAVADFNKFKQQINFREGANFLGIPKDAPIGVKRALTHLERSLINYERVIKDSSSTTSQVSAAQKRLGKAMAGARDIRSQLSAEQNEMLATLASSSTGLDINKPKQYYGLSDKIGLAGRKFGRGIYRGWKSGAISSGISMGIATGASYLGDTLSNYYLGQHQQIGANTESVESILEIAKRNQSNAKKSAFWSGAAMGAPTGAMIGASIGGAVSGPAAPLGILIGALAGGLIGGGLGGGVNYATQNKNIDKMTSSEIAEAGVSLDFLKAGKFHTAAIKKIEEDAKNGGVKVPFIDKNIEWNPGISWKRLRQTAYMGPPSPASLLPFFFNKRGGQEIRNDIFSNLNEAFNTEAQQTAYRKSLKEQLLKIDDTSLSAREAVVKARGMVHDEYIKAGIKSGLTPEEAKKRARILPIVQSNADFEMGDAVFQTASRIQKELNILCDSFEAAATRFQEYTLKIEANTTATVAGVRSREQYSNVMFGEAHGPYQIPGEAINAAVKNIQDQLNDMQKGGSILQKGRVEDLLTGFLGAPKNKQEEEDLRNMADMARLQGIAKGATGDVLSRMAGAGKLINETDNPEIVQAKLQPIIEKYFKNIDPNALAGEPGKELLALLPKQIRKAGTSLRGQNVAQAAASVIGGLVNELSPESRLRAKVENTNAKLMAQYQPYAEMFKLNQKQLAYEGQFVGTNIEQTRMAQMMGATPEQAISSLGGIYNASLANRKSLPKLIGELDLAQYDYKKLGGTGNYMEDLKKGGEIGQAAMKVQAAQEAYNNEMSRMNNSTTALRAKFEELGHIISNIISTNKAIGSMGFGDLKTAELFSKVGSETYLSLIPKGVKNERGLAEYAKNNPEEFSKLLKSASAFAGSPMFLQWAGATERFGTRMIPGKDGLRSADAANMARLIVGMSSESPEGIQDFINKQKDYADTGKNLTDIQQQQLSAQQQILQILQIAFKDRLPKEYNNPNMMESKPEVSAPEQPKTDATQVPSTPPVSPKITWRDWNESRPTWRDWNTNQKDTTGVEDAIKSIENFPNVESINGLVSALNAFRESMGKTKIEINAQMNVTGFENTGKDVAARAIVVKAIETMRDRMGDTPQEQKLRDQFNAAIRVISNENKD